jgi:5-methylcytosine-specific restriction protein A
MTAGGIVLAGDALVSALDAACSASASDLEMIEALRDYGAVRDRAEAAAVLLVGQMIRRGVFSVHGYTRPEYAVADLLGWDRRAARRRVKLAEQVCPRISLDGQELPARLPATGTVFAEGRLPVAVAEAIVAVLNSPAAARLRPEIWAGVEEQVAHYAATTRAAPAEVAGWARQLIEAYDVDGAEPGVEPLQVNELRMARKPDGCGGWIRGELDAPTFEAVATAIDALSKPHPDDTRPLEHRQADALGEICEFALRHNGSLPDTGGERPQVRVTVDLERLQAGVTGAFLDTGAGYTPGQLRMLACDCGVIPAVLGSNSEPLDIGRATRTIPAGIRRAVAIRDGGCAYPGCDRPPAWCDVHHCHEWADGGDTSLDNCVMLCRSHHRVIHTTEWSVRIRDGHPEFIPPEIIDSTRRTRRRPLVAVR